MTMIDFLSSSVLLVPLQDAQPFMDIRVIHTTANWGPWVNKKYFSFAYYFTISGSQQTKHKKSNQPQLCHSGGNPLRKSEALKLVSAKNEPIARTTKSAFFIFCSKVKVEKAGDAFKEKTFYQDKKGFCSSSSKWKETTEMSPSRF